MCVCVCACACAHACVCVCVCGPLAVNLRVVGLVTYHLLFTCSCVAIVKAFFRMTDTGDVANDSPRPLPVWWRPGQGRGPLSWALQALLCILCTRQECETIVSMLVYPCGMPYSPLLAYHVVHRHCARSSLIQGPCIYIVF